jgi:UDP-N-acetylmuramate: L-alanyl-gamma-D-glutamyl-meso-diaminopimelate ligase
VICEEEPVGEVRWALTGRHNMANALAALAAARHAGVPATVGVEALCRFQGVKRRMELRGEVGGVRLYDDFAHHPTAIETTLSGLRAQVGEGRIIAVLEPRSNTMRAGVHAAALPASLQAADQVLLYAPPELAWDAGSIMAPLGGRCQVFGETAPLVEAVAESAREGDAVVVMSNGGFDEIHARILAALEARS